MQTLTFGSALDRVVGGLRLEAIAAFLREFAQPVGVPDFTVTAEHLNQFDELIFDLRQGYEFLKLNPSAAVVLEALKIGRLVENASLSEMITALRVSSSRNQVRNHPALPRFLTLYHSAVAIINLRDAVKSLLISPKLDVAEDGRATLELEIIDYDNTGVPVERLRRILASLQRLYDSIEREVEPDGEPLRIGYVDTGSELLLAIVGAPIPLGIVAKLFEMGWREVRYWKANTHDRNMESLRNSIDVIALIGQHVEQRRIDPETANRLREIATSSITEMIGAGVMPKGVEEVERFDRRASLAAARDMKQISSGDPAVE